MNSGCAVVASSAIGAVPFLINDGENGLIYKNKNIKDLYNKVEFLLDHPQKRKNFGKNAYNTLITQWNATNAAKRFITLAEAVVKGEEKPDYFEDGVCSKAEILKDNWYKDKYLKKRG
jgi:glycosyltransferase involved in cell wall biosynthesis